MSNPPTFFDRVRRAAQDDWDELEARPSLAGPWRQMFTQVRSPHHVLSELLQNADDAGARYVRADLDGDVFTLEHDGQDFDEESLQSLCRFGSSNKRHLHTIGFRGLGFKSTFSYGPRVEVWTPTLAFAFQESRFTEPLWIDDAGKRTTTQIRIPLDSPEKGERLASDLERWATSAVPLLFFRNVEWLELQSTVVMQTDLGPGPAPGSKWVSLESGQRHRVLVVSSEEEAFPEDALEEIRRERGSESFELPPCRVQIVLGEAATGRLYVVLPTNVRPRLPFSCNAPFLQDPAREGIKDPLSSPTNRWLLQRIGRLAASTLLAWLGNTGLTPADRAEAYGLLPEPQSNDGSPDYQCTLEIAAAFKAALEGKPYLLTNTGGVVTSAECLGIPAELLGVWHDADLLSVFGEGGDTSVLSPHIPRKARPTLVNWTGLKLYGAKDVMARLGRAPAPPRPGVPDGLLNLWAFLEPSIHQSPAYDTTPLGLAIVPVEGVADLRPASQVLTVGENLGELTEQGWAFLVARIAVVDATWLERIGSAGARDGESAEADARWERAQRVFTRLRLDRRVGIQQIVERVTTQMFAGPFAPGDAIMLARIASRADVQILQGFVFRCQDGEWRRTTDGLLFLTNGGQAELLPPAWAASHLLHPCYSEGLSIRERIAWEAWARSERSRLATFPMPIRSNTEKYQYQDSQVQQMIRERGGRVPADFTMRTGHYLVEDYDFSPDLIKQWQEQAAVNPGVWRDVVRGIVGVWNADWERSCTAAVQKRPRKVIQALDHGPLRSAWLNRLRETPCLPDTDDVLRVPADLYRNNAETAPLRDTDLFVHADFDTDRSRPLLDLLGVRDRPVSADKVVERVRAISRAAPGGVLSPALVYKLRDLYRSLDQLLGRLDYAASAQVRAAFTEDPLILCDDGTWQNAAALYQRNDEDIPGVLLVHGDVRDLTLWDRIGVPLRPTLEHAMRWLATMEAGRTLTGSERRRVEAILVRQPEHVWSGLGYWLTLSGNWAPVADLHLLCRRRPTFHLFPKILRDTADVSMLSDDLTRQAPFHRLQRLEEALTTRLQGAQAAGPASAPGWLRSLADGLGQIRYGEDGAADSGHARRLMDTRWHPVTTLEVVPYLDGQPAGQAFSPEVLWHGVDLYVQRQGPRAHDPLVEAISLPFHDRRVQAAIGACVGRDADWITEYLEDHFDLQAPPVDDAAPASTQAEVSDGPQSSDSVAADAVYVIPEEEISAASVTQPELAAAEDDSPAATPGAASSSNILPEVSNPSEPPASALERRHVLTQKERIAAFWGQRGFTWSEADGLFADGRGNTVVPAASPGLYRKSDTQGTEQALVWFTDRPLDIGCEVRTEVWELLRQAAARAYIAAPQGEAGFLTISVIALLRDLEGSRVQLFPATYRLRVERTEYATATGIV